LVWISVFGLWALLSTLFSVTPAYTFGGGFAFVSLICFVSVAVGKEGIEKCTMPVIYACGMLTISAVVLYFVAPSAVVALTEGGNIPRLAGLTGSPNNLGRTASIALFFIYFAVRGKQTTPWRLDIVAVILSSVACLILSWSRTSIIALVLSIAVLKLRKRILLSIWGIAGALTVLLVLVMVDYNWDTLVRIVTRRGSVQELVTFTGRTAIWQFIWGKFLNQPIIGYGYGSTKLLMPLEFRTALGWTSTSAHNMLLQTLVTTGLVGASLVIMVLAKQARDFLKRPHDLADALFVFVLISGLFEPGAVGLSPNLLTIAWLISLAIPRDGAENVSGISPEEKIIAS
jgi:O-antigen ligase